LSNRPNALLISNVNEDIAAVTLTRFWDAGTSPSKYVGERVEVMGTKDLRISDDSGGVTSGIIDSIEEAPASQPFYSPLWQTDEDGNAVPKRYRIFFVPDSIKYKAVLNDDQINTYGHRAGPSGIVDLTK